MEANKIIITGGAARIGAAIAKKLSAPGVEIVIHYNKSKAHAEKLKKELTRKTQIDKFSVKKINDKKYRLSVGPFKNFSSLKSIYISLNNLGFEGINIYSE